MKQVLPRNSPPQKYGGITRGFIRKKSALKKNIKAKYVLIGNYNYYNLNNVSFNVSNKA